MILTGHPCRLYIDLDERPAAPNSRGHMKLLRELLRNFVKEHLQALRPNDKITSSVFVLESSKLPEKLSFHMIFKFYQGQTEFMFENNFHCRKVIEAFKAFFMHRVDTHESLHAGINIQGILLSKTQMADVRDMLARNIIDLSVYSKNRPFRLFNSSKKGSDRFLVYSDLTDPPFPPSVPKVALLRASLITYTNRSTIQIIRATRTGDNDAELKLSAAELAEPMTIWRRLSLPPEEQAPFLPDEDERKLPTKQACKTKKDQVTNEANSLTIACPQFVQDALRPYLPDADTRVTSMHCHPERENVFTLRTNSTFCIYKGSNHRSNHVYFHLDFNDFTIKIACFDSQCPQTCLHTIPIEPEDPINNLEEIRRCFDTKSAKVV